MTAIIILNWNGYRDTLACLESLFACIRQDFLWMVVDNGSSDDSVQEIATWLKNSGRKFLQVQEGETPQTELSQGQGVLYSFKENYGFAKGNNMGIALIEKLSANNKPSHYLLLNNDTLVEPDFLVKLESFAENHPQYVALTPQIRQMSNRQRICNCGGTLFFGLRIYHYENKISSVVSSKHYLPISLITGCAFFVKRNMLGFPDTWLQKKSERYATLPHSETEASDVFSNRFFFGEEDFDFSLRMQDQKKEMACVLDSVIYHKDGASRKNFLPTGHLYIHHLNRFVDIRQHWKPLKFFVWKLIYMPYIAFALFFRNRFSLKKILRYQKKLWNESLRLDGMDKALFLKWIEKA